MSAWTRLLAISTLSIGNAWDLLTHPRTSGTVANNGATVSVSTEPLTMVVNTPQINVALPAGLIIAIEPNPIVQIDTSSIRI